jgi:hypothetical protein
MLKTLVACAAALAFGAAGLSSAFAQTTAPSTPNQVQVQPVKTSDRTPGNPAPDRTPGASLSGAAGTEIGQTPNGTSDRTPSNHYRPPTN